MSELLAAARQLWGNKRGTYRALPQAECAEMTENQKTEDYAGPADPWAAKRAGGDRQRPAGKARTGKQQTEDCAGPTDPWATKRTGGDRQRPEDKARTGKRRKEDCAGAAKQAGGDRQRTAGEAGTENLCASDRDGVRKRRTAGRSGKLWFPGKAASAFCGMPEPGPEQAQLLRYAEAFEGLADLFGKLPCQRERLGDKELRDIFDRVQDQACAGCQAGQPCWEAGYLQTCRLLYELLTDLESGGSFREETKQRLLGRCGCAGQVFAALREGYEEARQNLLWENRMMEQRQAVGEQIRQTAGLLRRTAQCFSGDPKRERQIFRRLGKELRWLDAEAGAVRVFLREDGRPEIYLTLRTHRGIVLPVREAAEALSDCCGEKMRPAMDCRAAISDTPALFHFVPETRYQMSCGIARITKTGEMMSGDNYAFLQKDSGKVVMSLADGMGSGYHACRESETVIELVEQFLDAGFPQETAVRMINSCLLLQNAGRMFSTIDLCMVDLYNASCDLVKSGAADTFLCTCSGMEVIRSNTFPAGVLQQSDYAGLHRQLDSGSCIVMMTDGVEEALPEKNREAEMARLIEKCRTPDAKEFARSLMERVYLMQKMQARDDMTILAGTIWEKA